jgi:hypothetical protein
MRVFFLILLAALVIGTPGAYQQTRPPRPIDLNGLWKDNNRLVGIGQTDNIVIGMFKQPYTKCDPENGSPPQDRVKDFEGTLSGNYHHRQDDRLQLWKGVGLQSGRSGSGREAGC